MKKYEIEIDGKKATFILPDDYSISKDTMNYDEEKDYKKFIFNSKIRESTFKLLFIEDGVNGDLVQIDSFADVARKVFSCREYSIVWTEKKEKNDHIHYHIVNMYRIPYRNDKNEFLFSDSMYSHFEYAVNYDNRGYSFILSSKDHIKDFSYEEKRQILESIEFE